MLFRRPLKKNEPASCQREKGPDRTHRRYEQTPPKKEKEVCVQGFTAIHQRINCSVWSLLDFWNSVVLVSDIPWIMN